jgi:hypothetical protein
MLNADNAASQRVGASHRANKFRAMAATSDLGTVPTSISETLCRQTRSRGHRTLAEAIV